MLIPGRWKSVTDIVPFTVELAAIADEDELEAEIVCAGS